MVEEGRFKDSARRTLLEVLGLIAVRPCGPSGADAWALAESLEMSDPDRESRIGSLNDSRGVEHERAKSRHDPAFCNRDATLRSAPALCGTAPLRAGLRRAHCPDGGCPANRSVRTLNNGAPVPSEVSRSRCPRCSAARRRRTIRWPRRPARPSSSRQTRSRGRSSREISVRSCVGARCVLTERGNGGSGAALRFRPQHAGRASR
jgi:hypothetical protein